MQAKIQLWGNSLALRIPKAFAVEIGIDSDTTVDLSLVDGKLVVTPTPTFLLGDLLAGITEENLHAEVETGPSLGNEAW
ncbi:MAG: AbrB/MazE/SpoVT family DNA-binding domain-containing protein [Caldilineaceae bacterium]